jgi:hypothetical protein
VCIGWVDVGGRERVRVLRTRARPAPFYIYTKRDGPKRIAVFHIGPRWKRKRPTILITRGGGGLGQEGGWCETRAGGSEMESGEGKRETLGGGVERVGLWGIPTTTHPCRYEAKKGSIFLLPLFFTHQGLQRGRCVWIELYSPACTIGVVKGNGKLLGESCLGEREGEGVEETKGGWCVGLRRGRAEYRGMRHRGSGSLFPLF